MIYTVDIFLEKWKDRKILSVSEREQEMERWRKRVKSCFFWDLLLISKTPLLSVFSDFCSPILRVSEGCVYSRIHSGICLLYCQKMIGKNIGALVGNVGTFSDLKKPSCYCVKNCMNKIYLLKRRCHVLFEMQLCPKRVWCWASFECKLFNVVKKGIFQSWI